jgi:prophage tail gpP-like protein
MADETEIIVSGAKPRRPANELTIVVDGKEIAGWETVEVTLMAEGFPNSFAVSMSSKESATGAAITVKAGQECAVMLGDDVAIRGFVDRSIVSGDAQSHIINVMGRGKTQDLVDCSAEWPDGQLFDGDALEISKKLALPYGLEVKLGDGAAAGDKVPQWALNYGESGAEIIQRVALNAGLLAYEDNNGRLVLGTAGSKEAASGVAYGENVQSWSVETSMDGRFSEIVCCGLSLNSMMEFPGNDFYDTEKDPNVQRHRLKYMVTEQASEDPRGFTIKKAKWEVSRRAGRALAVRALVDSWRDSAGALWAPNTLVPVDVPGMTKQSLVLSEVTFRRSNDAGTTASLMLMPKEAFTPQPVSLIQVSAAELKGPEETPQ